MEYVRLGNSGLKVSKVILYVVACTMRVQRSLIRRMSVQRLHELRLFQMARLGA